MTGSTLDDLSDLSFVVEVAVFRVKRTIFYQNQRRLIVGS